MDKNFKDTLAAALSKMATAQARVTQSHSEAFAEIVSENPAIVGKEKAGDIVRRFRASGVQMVADAEKIEAGITDLLAGDR